MRQLIFTISSAVILLALIVAGWIYAKSDQELIRQLGAKRYAQREEASKKLAERGEPALPALKKAAAIENDLEIQRRAQELIQTIMHQARVSKSSGIELVIVPPGIMEIGSPMNERNRRDDELQHRVQVSEPFLLGKYEVTQQQFERIMKFNPSSYSKTGKNRGKINTLNPKTFPVENVSWFDAIDYCNRLSNLDGYKPYYALTDIKRQEKSIQSAKVKIVGGNGYRLPTEAEWEFACRGWRKTSFYYGTSNNGRQANMKATIIRSYGGNYRWKDLGRPTNVGSYSATAWELHDMHGNVAEWCWDWYAKHYYNKSPLKDPHGPESGSQRVTRGGSWLVNQYSCRSASRGMLAPGQREYHTGFRVARTP